MLNQFIDLACPQIQFIILQEMSVLLETSFGDIVIDLYTSKAPNACLNFIKLCKVKHYNNALFAEIQKNYVTKIRSPQATTIWKKTGLDVNYFRDEIDVQSKINDMGIVATANIGSNLNNSDFFITLTKSNLASLTGKHTVFGKVAEGLEVLRRINDTYVDSNHQPQMNIRIMHTFVLDDPFPDLQRMVVPDRSPSPVKDSERLQAIQHLEMLEKCKNESQIIEATRQQKAKKQAMTLQILGDLPDASLKPPENILFICKLNPITQERDLQIIFSRFGPIKSVQITRDWKTGQSLQYGFIQFENISSCEQAYLKMNNVIIDDRRIQVDFSQSVSKLLHKGKGGGLMGHKPKFGEKVQKKRELMPKSYTEGKFKGERYELIISNPSQPKPQQAIPEAKVEERVNRFRQEQEVEKIKEPKKKDKEKRKSKSRSREAEKKKHKKRSVSSSRDRHKSKKHKKEKYNRSSDSR